MEQNKVKFGIKNCYYSVISVDQNGETTYAEPKAFPGAVSLALDAEGGDPEPFYADDIIYYQSPGANNGYSGDFEVARVIDDFHIDVLGDVVDENGMLVEDAEAISKSFALMCEFKNDRHQTRHVLYNCTASRPQFGSSTIEATAQPQTETITITAIPQAFGEGDAKRQIVKAKANNTDSPTQYAAWFSAVQTPSFASATNGDTGNDVVGA